MKSLTITVVHNDAELAPFCFENLNEGHDVGVIEGLK